MKSFFLVTPVLILFLFVCPNDAVGQIALKLGLNYSSIRNEIPLKNINPILVKDLGVSFQYHPFKRFKKLSLVNEFDFNQKGYQQNLSNNYTFRFDYCSFPVLLSYSPVRPFSVYSGVEFSSLISTSIPEGMETYNHFDTGVVLGFSIHTSRITCLYVRGTYGLLPLLDYYRIDEMGNFTGEIHDLKNLCLSFGIKINIFNEKLQPYF